jgi:hypothetical protein
MSSPRVGDRVLENGKEGRVVALRPQDMVDVVFVGRDYPIRRPARSLEVMKSNPAKPKTPVFIAAVLTPEAKKQLYRWWSTQPLAPEPLAINKSSHMTIKFRPSLEEVALTPIGQEVILQVTGWAADGKIQAVSVEPQGVGSANAIPHVTFSIKDPSVAPKLSNDLFVTPGVRRQQIRGPALKARIGWSDGAEYHFNMPQGVQSNPGPRGGLSAAERDSLSQSAFALPRRRWPINDKRHAVIAMQYMLRGFGNKSDYPTILNAISKRYPREDKRNAEIWSFYAKHFGKPSRMVANPGTEIGPLSKLGQISYDNSPAYWAAEPYSVVLDGKLTHFEGKWIVRPSPINAVHVRFGDAVHDFMMQGERLKSRLDPADQRAIFDKVNRSEGSPFDSLEDFRAQYSEHIRRFEDFLDGYHHAAPELQRALRETLKYREPLRYGVIDVRQNPKDDVYDPAKEQFRAVVQGVYESLVRKKLGMPYNTPFLQAGGMRIDSSLDPEEKRKLVSSAYAIATRQGQKHGWLEPGTQTPTEKGRAAAFDRMAPQASEHTAQNRQDYERTLGSVRKSAYYRVVPEVVNGQKRYVVQPRPLAALVQIPAYRLSEDKAREDASRAEAALSKAPADLRARANPRRPPAAREERAPTREEVIAGTDISPEPSFVVILAGETLNELAQRFSVPPAILKRYPGLTVDSTGVVGPTNMRLSKADLLTNLYGSRVRDEAGKYETAALTPEEAEARRQRLMQEVMDANAARLEADVAALRSKAKAEQEGLRTAAKAKLKKHLEQRKLLKTPPKDSLKLPIPEEVLKIADRVYEDMRTGDVVLLTRGGQGDQPAKAYLHIPPYQSERPSYEVLAKFLNKRQIETALIRAGSPEKLFEALRDESIALERRGADTKTFSAALDDLQAEIADRAKQPVLLTAQQKKLQAELDEQDRLIEAEAEGFITPFEQEKLDRLRAKAPGQGQLLVYLRGREAKGTITDEEKIQLDRLRPAEEGKSEAQIAAQDRQVIAKMRAAMAQQAQTSIDTTRPYYDVELVLMLYKKKLDKDGFEVMNKGYPRRQYYTYTLKLDESRFRGMEGPDACSAAVEEAIKETGFEPFESAVYTGEKDGPVVVDLEQPRIEERYVLYIPRKKISIAVGATLGGTSAPTLDQLAGKRGGTRDRSKQLSGESVMFQKRAPTGGEFRGQKDRWVFVFSSERLAKYFVVSEKGLGGLPKEKEEAVGTVVAFTPPESLGKPKEDRSAVGGVDVLTLMQGFSKAAKAAKGAPAPRKAFLSPINNWAKYYKQENLYRSLRAGEWDEATSTRVGGMQTQQFEVFYTLSAPLAYLTIKFYNDPSQLRYVKPYMAVVRDVLALMPAAKLEDLTPAEEAKDQAELAKGYEDLVPVRVGGIEVLGLSKEQAASLRQTSVEPIPGRPQVMGSRTFTCGQLAYDASELNELLLGSGKLTTEAASVAQRLEILERAFRAGDQVGTFAGRKVYDVSAGRKVGSPTLQLTESLNIPIVGAETKEEVLNREDESTKLSALTGSLGLFNNPGATHGRHLRSRF